MLTPLARIPTYLFSFISLTNGASVSLTGVLIPSPGGGQNEELVVETVEVLGACDPEVHRSLTQMF
jgi:aspartyl/asparaginyl-tRNA synthetase